MLVFVWLTLMGAPTARQWVHALNEHREAHCRQDFSNHVHETEWQCDFDNHPFSPALRAPVAFVPKNRTEPVTHPAEGLTPQIHSQYTACFLLRGPPVTSVFPEM